MTQARTNAPGLGNPPLIQLLLEAVACAFVCLVETVRATFGMRFNRRDHDWHMTPAHEALPQTKPDTYLKEATAPTESRSALCRMSLLENPQGLADDPREAITCARDDALEACPLARVPGEGRDPASAQRALATRTFACRPGLPARAPTQSLSKDARPE